METAVLKVVLMAMVGAVVISVFGSGATVAAQSAVELPQPQLWLLVTLNGTCRREHTQLSLVSAGLLGFTPPGPQLQWAVCSRDGSQLRANVTLTPLDSLRLTHVLDRMRAHAAPVWLGAAPFAVCCYRRRQYRLAARRLQRPLDALPPVGAERLVYLCVAAACALLVLCATVMAAVYWCGRRRRRRRARPALPHTAGVQYSDELQRRRRRPPDVTVSPPSAPPPPLSEESFDDEEATGSDEDVLLDLLSRPPEPRDRAPAATAADGRPVTETDFF